MIEQKYIPDLILCSHAVRTQATARLINNSLHLMPEKIEVHRTLYHSNASDILRIVTGINQNTTDLMIIGHNPAISSFTNNLIDNDFLSFEPCSLAVIHFTSQKWSEISSKSGQLVLARKA